MPHSHIDSLNTNRARDKREEELRSYSPQSLETAYKVTCMLPMENDVSQLAAEAMIAAVLEKSSGQRTDPARDCSTDWHLRKVRAARGL